MARGKGGKGQSTKTSIKAKRAVREGGPGPSSAKVNAPLNSDDEDDQGSAHLDSWRTIIDEYDRLHPGNRLETWTPAPYSIERSKLPKLPKIGRAHDEWPFPNPRNRTCRGGSFEEVRVVVKGTRTRIKRKCLDKLLDDSSLSNLALAYDFGLTEFAKLKTKHRKAKERQHWLANRFLVFSTLFVSDDSLLEWIGAVFSPHNFPSIKDAFSNPMPPDFLTSTTRRLWQNGNELAMLKLRSRIANQKVFDEHLARLETARTLTKAASSTQRAFNAALESLGKRSVPPVTSPGLRPGTIISITDPSRHVSVSIEPEQAPSTVATADGNTTVDAVDPQARAEEDRKGKKSKKRAREPSCSPAVQVASEGSHNCDEVEGVAESAQAATPEKKRKRRKPEEVSIEVSTQGSVELQASSATPVASTSTTLRETVVASTRSLLNLSLQLLDSEGLSAEERQAFSSWLSAVSTVTSAVSFKAPGLVGGSQEGERRT